ncbi:MAG TPA: autotransporter-associated beta strand repeat-containing protein [Gemmataceae bacterium]|nr:autotransporter-associated beta strand repeat-containing protein [Gemmataceae bacterium]
MKKRWQKSPIRKSHVRPRLERLEDRLTPSSFRPPEFWTGLAGDGLWSSGGNWLSGVAPVNGDTVVFETNLTTTADGSTLNTSATAYNTTDDIANLSVPSIVFDDGTQFSVHTTSSDDPFALGGSVESGTTGYTIGGTNTINLGSDIFVQSGVSSGSANSVQEAFGGGLTINQIAASAILNNDAGTVLTLNGALAMGGNALTVTSANADSAASGVGVVLDGTISGSAGIILNGAVTLGGANTYTGTTTVGSTVNGTFVDVTNSSGLGNAGNTTTIAPASASAVILDGVSVAQANININGAATSANGLYGAGPNRVPGGTATYNGTVTLDANTDYISNITAGTRFTVNGAIIGGGGMLGITGIAGPGIVEFQQSTTYTGVTFVGFGANVQATTLQVDTPGGLGAGGNGTTVNAGSSLLLNFSSGTLQDGSGNAEQLTLSGAGVGNAGALQTIGGSVVVPGAITLDGVTDVAVSSGTLTAAGALLDDVSYGGSSGDLIKIGAGTMVLANTSTTASNYSNGTEIQAGILVNETATANTGLGTGNVQVDNNATLQLGYSPGTASISIANNIIFEGVAPAPGADASLEQLSSGVGQTDTITGNLQLLPNAASQVPIAVDSVSAFDLLDLEGAIITPGGPGTGGGFVLNPPLGAGPQGVGALLLFGAGSYGGVTSVDDGQLDLEGAPGVAEVSGSTLVISNFAFVNTGRNDLIAASTAAVINPNCSLFLDDTNQTIGALTITGGEVENTGAGVLTLTGDVTASAFIDGAGGFDPAVITGGVLALNASGGGNRNFTVNQSSPPPSTYHFDLAISATIENDSTGNTASSLTLLGDGVLSLEGGGTPNSYTGATTVLGGTLQVDDSQPQSTVFVAPSAVLAGAGTVGAVAFTGAGTGTLAPGDGPAVTGVLTAGGVTFGSGTIFQTQLNTSTAGSGYSQLHSSGTVFLGNGSATLDLALGGVFDVGTTFTLIQAAQINGTFADIPNGTIITASGTLFQINYTATTVTATVQNNPTTENFTVDVAEANEPIQLTMVVQFPPGTTSVSGTITFTYSTTAGDPTLIVPVSYNPGDNTGTGTGTVNDLPPGQDPVSGSFSGTYNAPPNSPPPAPQMPIAQPQVTEIAFVLNTDHSLIQLTPKTGTSTQLAPAGTILSISTVAAASGNVLFAVTALGNTMWEYSTSWTEISPGSFQQVSAATDASGNAVAFGVLGPGAGPYADSLWEYAGGTWNQLSPPGTIASVSVVTTAAGPTAFAIVTAGDNLWEHLPSGAWKQASAGSFAQISAGLNATGLAVVYGILGPGAGPYANSLWEDNAGAWSMLSGPGTILSVSAGGPDTAFAITTYGDTLWKHSDTGWSELSPGAFAQVSASAVGAPQDALFAVLTNGSIWDYADNNTPQWGEALNDQALFNAAP